MLATPSSAHAADAAGAAREVAPAPRPWGQRLFGQPARPWRVAFAAALLLWLPDVIYPWDWRPPGTSAFVYLLDCATFLLSYVLGSAVFLWCCARMDGWLRPRAGSGAARWLRVALAVTAVITAVEVVYSLCYLVVVPWAIGFTMPMQAFLRWAIHMAVVALVFLAWRASYHAARDKAAAIERVSAEADAMHGAVAAAELAMLEMQVEPHFLFNTLAHVRRELRHTPGQAVRMLTALIDYLERAGPALRRDDWTIADELELVETYLCLIRHRYGPRLQVSIDAPVALRATRLPALAIATLVENAVKHGLAPKAEGGLLQIAVAPDAALPQGVCISVIDNGVGLRQSQGLGLGLATVRARLRAAFGAHATLTLEAPGAAAGGGVRAAIRIAAAAAHA